jgi:hypothetical protein
MCRAGAVVLSVVVLHGAPAAAVMPTPQAARLLSFTLDQAEAAKGETVIATYQLDRPARRVTLIAMTPGGAPAGFRLPQQIRSTPSRDAGAISFTVPSEANAISPLWLMLNVDGQLRGAQRLNLACDYPWFFEPRVEGCPFAPARATPAAFQRFERGAMIWLAEMDSIYVLYDALHSANAARLERYDDVFIEGSPEPPLTAEPPSDRFAPVRGFGLVWRTREHVRDALGWALAPEQGYTACLGYAHYGGKSMRTYVTTVDRSLLEFETYYVPVRWRALREIDGRPVAVAQC